MSVEPKIVALETSGRAGSVALALGGKLLLEETFQGTMRHAAELMPTVSRLCQQAGWRADEIQQIYVSTGPGSFTGLRIALSVARAISQATGCKLLGIQTLDVLACNAPAEVDNLVVMLDAKRGQVFAAHYGKAPASVGSASAGAPHVAGARRQVHAATLIRPAEILAQAAKAGPVSVLGEGIDYHRSELGDAIELDRSLWPARAAAVYQLGWAKACRGEFTARDELLPVYIRLAEAEEVWRKKRGLAIEGI
jgi:tRNA threonylcarbamoyladenosine biosynthesis protein TsaB